MTPSQPYQSSNGPRRSTVALAIAVALALVMCDDGVFARPRTWADQDTSPARQPSWMPFALGDRTPNPAVAQITAVEGKTLAQGSGTLVDVRGQHALIVTNWHVIRSANGPIVATFPDGFRSAATVLKVDADWDLAALLIWRPNASPIAISTTAPRPGDPLTIAGYGAGNYRAVTGRCTQYVAPGMDMPYEMVEVSAEARQGDSGGPILNERGELAGVLFGAAGGTTSGSFCGRVRWFLDAAWPAERIQEADTLVSIPSGAGSGDPRTAGSGDPRTAGSGDPRTAGVSLPAYEPSKHWPPDSLVVVPQVSTESDRTIVEPTPNYFIGSTLTPAPRSASKLPDSRTGMDFNALAGTTPIEQAKTILAAIGVLAVIAQIARGVRGDAKKPLGSGK